MRRGALVLCGGRSRRMGRDKAWLEFGDEALLQIVCRRLRTWVSDLVVVGREGQTLPPLSPKACVTRDVVADKGPLGGLLTGLRMTQADAVFVTACDAPFLRRGVVDLLFDRLGSSEAAVAEVGGFPHPLCATYRREVLPHVERLLAEDRLRPVFLYDYVDTVRVSEAALREADPDLASLEECNTPEAYAAALARWQAGAGCVVRVEFFEGARALAGGEYLEVEASTLGEALAAAVEQRPALAPRVIVEGRITPHWRANVNGLRFVEDPDTALEDGDAVLLVSALAGG